MADEATDESHDHVGVDPEELLHGEAGWGSELHEHQVSTSFQHATHLAQSRLEVLEVTGAIGDGDGIKGAIWAARNKDYKGNGEYNIAMDALGLGNQWKDDPEKRAKLHIKGMKPEKKRGQQTDDIFGPEDAEEKPEWLEQWLRKRSELQAQEQEESGDD